MLLIDNATVERLLPMDECIDAQDYAFRGLPTGESVHRPRIDLYMRRSARTATTAGARWRARATRWACSPSA